MAANRQVLFEEVCSQDFLQFKFGERGYQDQLNDSIAKTGALAAVKVEVINIPVGDNASQDVVWVAHNFGFLGGSLGCAEGEKITRAFEYALEKKLPVCVQCRSGGARMQEGTSSLMQMAKVSVAVQALQSAGLPFLSVLCDPTYGGVSASYAMQADIRIAVVEESEAGSDEARIGFAGPAVILNTMCEANQAVFDTQCPPDFQYASFVHSGGQVDLLLHTPKPQAQANIESKVAQIARLIMQKTSTSDQLSLLSSVYSSKEETLQRIQRDGPEDEAKAIEAFNYTRSRRIDRPQTQDIIHAVFSDFVELSGDGKVGRDACLRGGLAAFHGLPVVVLATFKGHTPTDMQASNYGMPSPHGYRTALRLMRLAERFGLPVVTLVDTVGAWPTFDCERYGQSEAIATNLTAMAGLRVPIITVMVGEGGSGGALGICMGNHIAMLSGGYFGVISPEGAASILGRYRDDQDKAERFPRDCQALATAQCIYAHQLRDLGVVDFILWEEDEQGPHAETFRAFPALQRRIGQYVAYSLQSLLPLTPDQLVQQRYGKYRALGSFALLDDVQRSQAIAQAKSVAAASLAAKQRAAAKPSTLRISALVTHLAEETVRGGMSRYRKLCPATQSAKPLRPQPWDTQIVHKYRPVAPPVTTDETRAMCRSAKAVLDQHGVHYLCQTWIPAQAKHRVLVTDTTMRDAHQSLLATRVRTEDLLPGALLASNLLGDAFSLECWGGATFDVCMRFLDECPWDRLRALRAACPNVCLQMLIRGANAVGYTSYPDNVVTEFIRLAAENGMDVFRIFDCFNIVDNMRVAIDAVRATGKIAEVAICYTGNVLTSSIYTLDYYEGLAKEIREAGADMLCIKDMAGLLRPYEVEPLLAALRRGMDHRLPIHFHTHATSSGSLATCLEMARCGCEIMDFATASMADGTSQPSLNTFLAMTQGGARPAGIDYMSLEPYDLYWAGVREVYSPFESGMKSGTARVFDHQIPGGQYSNLLVQSASLGLTLDQWSAVLDAYRDVNALFGDVVKVTPSSKCVGDLAIYLVLKGLHTSDLVDPHTGEPQSGAHLLDFPNSIVGLFKGDLGFPHRGFPSGIEKLVLKGAAKRTQRAGLTLPPADLSATLAQLTERYPWYYAVGAGAQVPQDKDNRRNEEEKEKKKALSAEDAMSYLMYPQVFEDYMARREKKGPLLTALPSTVYLYATQPGDVFELSRWVDGVDYAHDVFAQAALAVDKARGRGRCVVRMECQRVSAIAHMHRNVVFKLQLVAEDTAEVVYEEVQTVRVKDTGGVFVFEGPMADPARPLDHVASPMAGIVEKVLVKAGDAVRAGDVLAMVSAMKMEVKVSAPRDGVVQAVAVPAPGYRVVEGALLVTL